MHTSRTQMWPLWLLATALILLAGITHARAALPDWPRVNHQLVQQHVLPGYTRLSDASARLAQASDALCLAPSADTLARARAAWQDSMQAWQGIQHIQFGPVQFLMRNFGLQFWPDRKNIGARQLRQALASTQPYDAEFFRQASVSIQGLPALERLLFAEQALEQLQQGRHCELTRAIAGHVAATSRAIVSEWQTLASTEFSPDQDADSAAEWAVELMAALVEPVEVIRDTKLLKPLGDSPAAARPGLLESHRSGTSLANIRANLAALQALYAQVEPLLRAAGAAELATTITQQFVSLTDALPSIEQPLKQTIRQPATHARLLQLAEQLRQLNDQLARAMDVLNIQLGFNSRDGD